MTPRDTVVDWLYNLYKQQGYVTEDNIFDLCDGYELSISDLDYVSNKLISLGVFISEEKLWDRGSELSNQDENSIDFILSQNDTDADIIDAFNDDLSTFDDDFDTDDDNDLSTFDDANLSNSFIATRTYQQSFSDQDIEVLEFFHKNYPQFDSIVNQIWRTPRLRMKRKQSRELWIQIKSGNIAARNNLVERYMIMSLKATYLYHNKTDYPLDELLSEAFASLLRAFNAYDYNSGRGFAGYSLYYIYNDLRRFIYNTDRIVRIPLHIREKITNAVYLWDNYSNESIRDFEESVYGEFSSYSDFLKYMAISNMESIEELLEQGNEDVFPKDNSIDLFEACCSNHLSTSINEILNLLTEREVYVLCRRFGIGYEVESTLEEIANTIGVTRERVRQIEMKALKKIRTPSILEKYRWFLD